ncbi:MAG TPA: potassium channel family protein, partial [Polyangiaceae bacterium]
MDKRASSLSRPYARTTVRRVGYAITLFTSVTLIGGALIWVYGDGEYTLAKSIYFSLITVTTVGFGELPNMDGHAGARVVTAFTLISGVVAIALFQSTLTTFLIEGVMEKALRRRRMERKIEALSKHTVVAGAGRTGRYIVEELVHAKSHFVVIDTDEAKLEKINQELGGQLLYIVGDATDDHVLTAAGIERATGVITALPDDRDNLFVTLSVRSVNPKTRIVAKVVEIENEGKIVRAGADSTVSPHRIGGLRLVSELLRPRVTEFLDRMLRARKDLQFD